MDCVDCSEEYGPCEKHSELITSREGASLRTADELCELFIEDAVALGAELSAYGRVIQARVNDKLSNESWLEDADLAEELRDVTNQMETELSTLGYSTYWDDGYRIIRVTGGPLAEEPEEGN